MGRGVSRHKYSIETCYEDVSWMGHDYDEDTGEYLYDFDSYDQCKAEWDWQDWVEWQQEKAKELFPSMTPCDEWLDREDRAIMENDHAYIGVSEYCGQASIWLVCKADLGEGTGHDGISMAWCHKAAHGFSQKFGDLVRLGTMSNGESVYQRKGA